jgi:thiamine-monophosphate kinase
MASETSESELLRKLSSLGFPSKKLHGAASQLRLGIGDDAALFVTRPGCENVLTCDWSVEGIHFVTKTHPPDSIGWKCLARAVSDLAAMGAQPKCFLMSLALPAPSTGAWLDGFLDGLNRASKRFGCPLAGGDTTRHDRVLINVTAVGEVPAGKGVLRSGARVGDDIYVTGRLGQAALGLRIVQRKGGRLVKTRNQALQKHFFPEPRLLLGRWLRERNLPTAMMDLSDGLSSDLNRLCAASRVGANIETSRIPITQASKIGFTSTALSKLALHGGEDYELLFTVPSEKARRIPRFFRGIPLTRIGQVTRGPSVLLTLPDGRQKALIPLGWDPFRR